MSSASKLSLLLVLLLLVALVAAIVRDALQEDVVTGLQRLLASPWGVTTLADLAVGLAFAAVWIAVMEGPRRAWPWWLGLITLGNVALLIFLMVRLLRTASLQEAFTPAPR